VIEWQLTPEDVARTRFAYSPLCELVLSLVVLRSPARHSLHLPWVRSVRPRLSDLDLTELFALTPVQGVVADFLSPPPTSPLPDFAAELDLVRTTPTIRWSPMLPTCRGFQNRSGTGSSRTLMVLLNGSAGPSGCTGSWRSSTSGRGCGRCSRRTYCGAPAAWPWAEPTRCSRTYTRPSPGTVIDCPRPIRGTTRVRCPAKGSSSCRAPWPGPPCGDGRAVPAGDHLSRSRHRDPLGDRTTPVIAGAHRSARTNPRPPTHCPRRTELDQRTRQAPRCHTRSGQPTPVRAQIERPGQQNPRRRIRALSPHHPGRTLVAPD